MSATLSAVAEAERSWSEITSKGTVIDMPSSRPSVPGVRVNQSSNRTAQQFSFMPGSYDGGDGRRLGYWGLRSVGPNASMQTWKRDINRIREESVINPQVQRAISVYVANVIGSTGFSPRIARYPELNKIWTDWTRECDPRGEYSLLGLQQQVMTLLKRDSGALVRFRPRPDLSQTPRSGVSFQIQVLEIDHLDIDRTKVESGDVQGVPSGSQTINGVCRSRFDDHLIGYFVKPRHPDDPAGVPTTSTNQARFVPGSEMLYIKRVGRPGESRPSPQLRSILPTMKDRQDYLDASIVKGIVSSRRVYWIKTPGLDQDGKIIREIFQARGGTVEDINNGVAAVSMPENGDIGELPPGYDVIDCKSSDVGNNFMPFFKVIGQEVAAGTDTPYCLVTMDTDGVNDRIARWTDIQFERHFGFDQTEYMVNQFLQKVFEYWLSRLFLYDKRLPLAKYDLQALFRVPWNYPKRAYLNRLQEAQADVLRRKELMESRSSLAGEDGEDTMQIMLECVMEDEFMRQTAPDTPAGKRIAEMVAKRVLTFLDAESA